MTNQYTRFEFRGSGLTYLMIWFASYIFSIVTLYLATPWLYCWRVGWLISNSYINNRRLIFRGSGIQVFGLFIWILFASIFTLGLYIPFGIIRIEKWKFENTYFEDEIISGKRISQNDSQNTITSVNDPVDFNLLPREQLDIKPLEVTCINCNTQLELEKQELEAKLFICPICETENRISIKQPSKTAKNNYIEVVKLEQKVYIEPKNIDEKDFICYSCKSILTLEGDELNQDIYTCPVCNKLNKITI